MNRKDFNTDGVRNVANQYLACIKIYVQTDGTVLCMIGNQKIVLSPDDVRKLLDGVIEYGKVFAALNRELETATLEILEQNRVNGH